MPKILINETNNTSPGTPASYGNYSVLITGYKGAASSKSDAMLVSPDANGVYEFSSAQAFKDTIGLTDVERKNSAGVVTEYHYGNRMAYHLLDLGYTVIYKTIEQIKDMESEAFWEIFKDKASYDFRFVSHGLLETCYDAKTHSTLYARLLEIRQDVETFAGILDAVAEINKLSEKEKTALLAQYDIKPDEYTDDVAGKYLFNLAISNGYTGFKDRAGVQYTYETAKANLTKDNDGKIPALATQEALIEKHAGDRKVTPVLFNTINGNIAKLASYVADDKEDIPGRGDCTALIELDEDIYCEADASQRPEALIVDGINNMASNIGNNGAYCAMTVPSVYYKISGDAVKFPGAFHYLACFMSSLRAGFAEWYAAAGYTRGVSSYVIDHTSVKLGEIAINALEPRKISDQNKQPKFACNVIANFRGSYYLWGNRTAAPVLEEAGGGDLTAEHFLNIRQLCTTIKKQVYVSCRRFTFDPNSDTLWFNFVNSITPTLDAMKADQGIRDYRIVKVYTDKKATLKAKIRIIPIEAVEDFDIEVSLEDSFGETAVNV